MNIRIPTHMIQQFPKTITSPGSTKDMIIEIIEKYGSNAAEQRNSIRIMNTYEKMFEHIYKFLDIETCFILGSKRGILFS